MKFVIRIRRSDREGIDPVTITGARNRADAENSVKAMYGDRLTEIVRGRGR